MLESIYKYIFTYIYIYIIFWNTLYKRSEGLGITKKDKKVLYECLLSYETKIKTSHFTQN